MEKNVKKKIKALYDLVIKEAENNEVFAEKLELIMLNPEKERKTGSTKRSGNRRDKAVLDPILLAEEGKLSKDVLEPLTDKELKDIVADYGMDPSKLAMKWKDRDRLIKLIIDTSQRRALKGDAFRA
jgi:hypothetical protein